MLKPVWPQGGSIKYNQRESRNQIHPKKDCSHNDLLQVNSTVMICAAHSSIADHLYNQIRELILASLIIFCLIFTLQHPT